MINWKVEIQKHKEKFWFEQKACLERCINTNVEAESDFMKEIMKTWSMRRDRETVTTLSFGQKMREQCTENKLSIF